MKINSQYGKLNFPIHTIEGIEKIYHSKETNNKKYSLNKENKEDQKQFNEILKDKIAKTK